MSDVKVDLTVFVPNVILHNKLMGNMEVADM